MRLTRSLAALAVVVASITTATIATAPAAQADPRRPSPLPVLTVTTDNPNPVANQPVTLTATATSGPYFIRWRRYGTGGPLIKECAHSQPCSITVTSARAGTRHYVAELWRMGRVLAPDVRLSATARTVFWRAAPRLRLQVLSVHCGNPEDIHGRDELYFVGAVGDRQGVTPAITKPLSIGGGQHRDLVDGRALLYDGRPVYGQDLHISVEAFDEDFAKTWQKYDEFVREAGVLAGRLTENLGPAAAAGAAVQITTALVAGISSGDKDDRLGRATFTVPVEGPAQQTATWRFKRTGGLLGYSTWNYTVTLLLTRESTPAPAPIRLPG